MRTRHGFTLIELLVVLIIMGTVSAGVLKLLTSTQRFSRAQAERVDLQSNVRAAAFVLPTELRELNTVVGGTALQNDVLQALDTSITYRAARGLGFVCTQSTTVPRVYAGGLWQGTRGPVVGDSLYVFYKGASVSADAWAAGKITGWANSTCPNPNGAGTVAAYTLTLETPIALPDMGTPVRTFEEMKLVMYANSGSKWLGAQSLSAGDAGPQPMLGPLASTGGLLLQYLDANGAVTATLPNIKSIRIKVVGQTTQRITTGGNTGATNAIVLDSLVTQVSLRNALR